MIKILNTEIDTRSCKSKVPRNLEHFEIPLVQKSRQSLESLVIPVIFGVQLVKRMRIFKRLLPVAVISTIVLLSSCGKKEEKPGAIDSLAISYKVINTLPHNPESFIEGLVIHDNKIYESTGGKQSWIAEVNA